MKAILFAVDHDAIVRLVEVGEDALMAAVREVDMEAEVLFLDFLWEPLFETFQRADQLCSSPLLA